MHASEFTDRGEHAYGGVHANVGNIITSYDRVLSGRGLEKSSSGYNIYGYNTYGYTNTSSNTFSGYANLHRGL